MFPLYYWELIMMALLSLGATIIYILATKNRGSFVDTPDWSKVVRRIVEFAAVFLMELFIIFQGWNYSNIPRIVLVLVPVGGVSLGICSIFLARKEKKLIEHQDDSSVSIGTESKANWLGMHNRLYEHLTNTIILSLFLLVLFSAIVLTLSKYMANSLATDYCTVLLLVFLALELTTLLYHIFRLIHIENLPNKEIAQVLKIFKFLDE